MDDSPSGTEWILAEVGWRSALPGCRPLQAMFHKFEASAQTTHGVEQKQSSQLRLTFEDILQGLRHCHFLSCEQRPTIPFVGLEIDKGRTALAGAESHCLNLKLQRQ